MSLADVIARNKAEAEAGIVRYFPEHETAEPRRAPVAAPGATGPCRHFDPAPLDRGSCGSCVAKWVYPCEVYGRCSPHGWHPGVKRCDGCAHHAGRGSERPEPDVRRIVLVNENGPSAVLVLSAAVESLHRAHPGRFVTAVDGPGAELLGHNPHVVSAESVIDGAPVVWDRFPISGAPDESPLDAMRGGCDAIAAALGVPVPLAVDRPCVSLSPDERGRVPQVHEAASGNPRYWLVDEGGGDGGPAGWPGAFDLTRIAERVGDRVRLVRVGTDEPARPAHPGVLDLQAGPGLRELARAVWHAVGGIGPSGVLRHLCAAFEKPYVYVGGAHGPGAYRTDWVVTGDEPHAPPRAERVAEVVLALGG